MLIIFILSLTPVVIWAFIEPLGSRFSDMNTITTSLGQIFGLVGMALFSINLILAGRLKFLDKHFKGLDKVYIHHSKLGSIAFSLILFHPIFLVVKILSISIYEAGLFFVPFLNMPITWGIISLTIMIVLIVLTFYIKIKYHIWKMSHRFMTIAFIFAILHVFTIASDTSRSDLLRYYILTLAFIGLFVSVYQAFFNKFLSKKFRYKIVNIKELNEEILEIEMEPVSKKIDFSPGQFAFFAFISDKLTSESHPFSISSSGGDYNLKITVKNLGDYTGLLKNLNINDDVLIDGPYGNFSCNKIDNKNQIWIAGGIGITPFFSMATSLGSEYNIDLYYSVKEAREAVYLDKLNDISNKNNKFKFNLWNAKDKGYINSDQILNLSNGLDSKDIFLCGPPSFMENLKEQFLSLGVDIKKIHYENFNLS